MFEEKLITVREASLILNITEKEVIELAESGKIPAYKVGGQYLRFKRTQIEEFKKKLRIPHAVRESSSKYSLKERLQDFIYFYDFYILSILLVIWMLIIILRG